MSDIIWNHIREALLDPRFVWRTIPRLGTAAGGLTNDEVVDILRLHPDDVVFGRSRTGELIVRLKSRLHR